MGNSPPREWGTTIVIWELSVDKNSDFVIIDRDDGTQDTVYGEGPGSSFTSSNGHRYWS